MRFVKYKARNEINNLSVKVCRNGTKDREYPHHRGAGKLEGSHEGKCFNQLRISRFFTFSDVEKPTPGDDEVLVKVIASAVNSWDWQIMMGDVLKEKS